MTPAEILRAAVNQLESLAAAEDALGPLRGLLSRGEATLPEIVAGLVRDHAAIRAMLDARALPHERLSLASGVEAALAPPPELRSVADQVAERLGICGRAIAGSSERCVNERGHRPGCSTFHNGPVIAAEFRRLVERPIACERVPVCDRVFLGTAIAVDGMQERRREGRCEKPPGHPPGGCAFTLDRRTFLDHGETAATGRTTPREVVSRASGPVEEELCPARIDPRTHRFAFGVPEPYTRCGRPANHGGSCSIARSESVDGPIVPERSRCRAWSYPGQASWDVRLAGRAGGVRCCLASGHQGDHALARVTPCYGAVRNRGDVLNCVHDITQGEHPTCYVWARDAE